jgi:hypothetical protein
MIIVMVEIRPVVLRLSRQKGCLQEACFKEFKTGNDIFLLHHKGGDAKLLLSQFLCFLYTFCFCYVLVVPLGLLVEM